MRVSDRLRPVFVAGLVAALLWLASGALFWLLTWNSILPSTFTDLVLPETVPGTVWMQPAPWNVLVPLGSAVVLALAYTLLARLVDIDAADAHSPRVTRFAAAWFVALAASLVATLPWAVAVVAAGFPLARATLLLNPLGDSLFVAVYWGLIWGWIPAIIATHARRRALVPPTPGVSTPSPRRLSGALAILLVLAMVGAGIAASSGLRAARLQAAAEEAIDSGHTIGNLPDPDIAVTPPPTVAPSAAASDPSWCTADQAVVLLGERDAATGHRVQSMRAMNVGATPCVLDGYPDLAFADQNGSVLDVTVAHGGSFMATDAGARPITLAPGGQAIARLGWNAMAPAGADVTYALHAALYAGLVRGSWPVTLDIVAGGEVAVTAWEPDDGVAAGD